MKTRARVLSLLLGWFGVVLCGDAAAQLPAPAQPLPPPVPAVGSTFDPAAAGITVLGDGAPMIPATLHVVDLCRFGTPFVIGGPKGPGVFNGETGGWAINSPRFIQDTPLHDQVQFRLCLNFNPPTGAFQSWSVWLVFGANPWGIAGPIAFRLGAADLFGLTPGIPAPFPAGVFQFNVILTGSGNEVLDTVDPSLVLGPFPVPPPVEPVPRCAITGSGERNGTSFLDVTVQAGNGLAAIAVVASENADTQVPPFAEGTTAPVVVTATKLDPNRRSTVVLSVYDQAGNTIRCDPVIARLTAETPLQFELAQNYPNPFNPSTKITFRLPEQSEVVLEVFDVTGRRVATLVDGVLEPGSYEAEWDGRSDAGVPVAGGVYFVRLTSGAFADTKTMMLLK